MMGGLELGRIHVAARAVGVARAALEDSLRYAQQRETFGQPIWRHQAVGHRLADMATRVDAARLLTLRAAAALDAGRRSDLEAGMAKLFASEACLQVTADAIKVHGGYGYLGRVRHRALLPRRAADGGRRGHQRHPAQRHHPAARRRYRPDRNQ